MTDQPEPVRETTDPDGSHAGTATEVRPPARPRWVIWLVIGIAVAVLVLIGVHLLMGGGGGPANHTPGMSHAG